MSTVNRNSHQIKKYTNSVEQVSLPNAVKNLNAIKTYLNFLSDIEDPNLEKTVAEAQEIIKICFDSIRRLQEVNTRLGKESDRLISVSMDTDFITIKTEPVETALSEISIIVNDFYNFVCNYTDNLKKEIYEKILQGSLVEFRSKITELLNSKILQRQQLVESSNEDDDQDNSQQLAQLDAQIDRLKKCLVAADTYEKRINLIILELESPKKEARRIVDFMTKINNMTTSKINSIKDAVNN